MANSSIPLPPQLGPAPDGPFATAPPGTCVYRLYDWHPEHNAWEFNGNAVGYYLDLPLGYYRSPLSFTQAPMVVWVTARTDVSGNLLPNVLAPQDAPTATDSDSWPGMGPVDAGELGFVTGNYGILSPWFVDYKLSTYDALLQLAQTAKCPPGFEWDIATETCKAIITGLIPVCPPGTVWDPTTETCIAQQGQQPPKCPPGSVWNPITETCDLIVVPGQPCIPVPTPYDDTLTEGLNCVSENLIVIQQLLQQMKQGGGGGGGKNPDPVTCAQITAAANAIVTALAGIARAIATAAAGGQPVDLTPVVVQLAEIAGALAKLANAPAEQPADLSHLNTAADADVAARELTVANTALVKAQVTLDAAALGQGLS